MASLVLRSNKMRSSKSVTKQEKLSNIAFKPISQFSTSSFSRVFLHKSAVATTQTFGTQSIVFSNQVRFFSAGTQKTIKVPQMGDSITEGTIRWVKNPGDGVAQDELIANIETDKVNVEVRAPESGTIETQFAKSEDTVKVGTELYILKLGAAPAKAAPAPKAEAKTATPTPTPVATPAAPKAEAKAAPAPAPSAPASAPATPKPATVASGVREHKEKMSRMRARIASRLKDSQNTYAMLTTFNECDMSALVEMRNSFKDEFQKKHGVKFGYMSAFVKAACAALKDQPVVNAVIEGDHIVYRDYVDISVAVATPTGLVVPILRNAEQLSMAGVEKAIGDLGVKARDGKLAIEDMTGGTFTISNGGVYGSMMGTPIINPPQSAILGMHNIVDRAVVVNGQIVIRPVMYLALTYDHRLIDGREAVTFLKKIKSVVEDPRRLLLDL